MSTHDQIRELSDGFQGLVDQLNRLEESAKAAGKRGQVEHLAKAAAFAAKAADQIRMVVQYAHPAQWVAAEDYDSAGIVTAPADLKRGDRVYAIYLPASLSIDAKIPVFVVEDDGQIATARRVSDNSQALIFDDGPKYRIYRLPE